MACFDATFAYVFIRLEEQVVKNCPIHSLIKILILLGIFSIAILMTEMEIQNIFDGKCPIPI